MNCTMGAIDSGRRGCAAGRSRCPRVPSQAPTRSASSVAGEPHMGCSLGVASDAAVWVKDGEGGARDWPRRPRSVDEGPSVRWSLPCRSVCAGFSGPVLAALVPARSERWLWGARDCGTRKTYAGLVRVQRGCQVCCARVRLPSFWKALLQAKIGFFFSFFSLRYFWSVWRVLWDTGWHGSPVCRRCAERSGNGRVPARRPGQSGRQAGGATGLRRAGRQLESMRSGRASGRLLAIGGAVTSRRGRRCAWIVGSV